MRPSAMRLTVRCLDSSGRRFLCASLLWLRSMRALMAFLKQAAQDQAVLASTRPKNAVVPWSPAVGRGGTQSPLE